MIAVVHIFQLGKRFIVGLIPPFCQQFDVRAHLGGEFLLADAAKGLIVHEHGDVLQLVEAAEYAHL